MSINLLISYSFCVQLKMKFRISRIRREFGAPVNFTTRSASDAKDGIIECPSYEEETPSFLKRELDKGIQVFMFDIILYFHGYLQYL